MDFDTAIKLTVYQAIIETERAPSVVEVAERAGASREAVGEAFRRLAGQRALVLEPDGATIRMAMPFSGVATPHRVHAGGRRYYANCAWDALGVPAALRAPAVVESRCGWSGEPIWLEVGAHGLAPAPSVAHFAVPAVHWWKDIVYT
jgi:alkylmercury lyase